MNTFELKQPDFLFCEIAKKDGSDNDDRIWIYHLKSNSLIEFINQDDFPNLNHVEEKDLFNYLDEEWRGVFIQNNCESKGYNSEKVLKAAWDYLCDYFDWEEQQDDF